MLWTQSFQTDFNQLDFWTVSIEPARAAASGCYPLISEGSLTFELAELKIWPCGSTESTVNLKETPESHRRGAQHRGLFFKF